mmetsp:Transcript_4092/g.12656  ORF Transcript_4092/g.12656 Transcript_4092/m.12656 type:complete len:353 (+) Transcript_4092:150-1208(+)
MLEAFDPSRPNRVRKTKRASILAYLKNKQGQGVAQPKRLQGKAPVTRNDLVPKRAPAWNFSWQAAVPLSHPTKALLKLDDAVALQVALKKAAASKDGVAHLKAAGFGWRRVREVMQSDVSANTKTAMGAVRLGDAALAGDALTQKRSIYETVRSDPLHVAAWRGDLATVKVLLANGAYVRDTDAGGRSALHLVCDGSRPHFSGAGGRCAIVALLLDSGADVDASDDRGDSPLHCACRSGDAQLVHLLVSRGADATVANRRGTLAADVGQLETLQVSLSRRGDDPRQLASVRCAAAVVAFVVRSCLANSKPQRPYAYHLFRLNKFPPGDSVKSQGERRGKDKKMRKKRKEEAK